MGPEKSFLVHHCVRSAPPPQSPPLPPPSKYRELSRRSGAGPAVLQGKNAPSLSRGRWESAFRACAAPGRGRERELGAPSGEAATFPLFPLLPASPHF